MLHLFLRHYLLLFIISLKCLSTYGSNTFATKDIDTQELLAENHRLLQAGFDFAPYHISSIPKNILQIVLNSIYTDESLNTLWLQDGICYLKADCLKDLLLKKNIHSAMIFWINDIEEACSSHNQWSYHVANYIYSAKNEILILDPFFSKEILTQKEWLNHLEKRLNLGLNSLSQSNITLKSPKIFAYNCETKNFVTCDKKSASWKEYLEKTKIQKKLIPHPGIIGL